MNRKLVLEKLAAELELFRGASVLLADGPDGERTLLTVNGIGTSSLVQLYPEGRDSKNRWRLNIGIPTMRRVFIQQRDGGFRWTEAAKALWLAVKKIMETKDYVAVQLTSNDDHFRLVLRCDLFRIATKGSEKTRSAELWSASFPFETSGTSVLDYVLVTDDDESWDDLRQQLEEEGE